MDLNTLDQDAQEARNDRAAGKPSPAKPVIAVSDETGTSHTQNRPAPVVAKPKSVSSDGLPRQVEFAEVAEEDFHRAAPNPAPASHGISQETLSESATAEFATVEEAVEASSSDLVQEEAKKSPSIFRALIALGRRNKKEQTTPDKEPSKVSTSARRNRFPFIVAGLVLLLLVFGVVSQVKNNQLEQEALDRAAASRKTVPKGVTDLLDAKASPGQPEPGGPGLSGAQSEPKSPPPSASASAVTTQAAPAAKDPLEEVADPADRQKALLEALKRGDYLKTAPSTPTSLPADINSAPVPSSPSKGGGSLLRPQEQVQRSPIPEEIETRIQSGSPTSSDPLDRVQVYSGVKVDRSGVAPYSIKAVRDFDDGTAVFLFPKGGDPLIQGKWYFEGDVTPEGWTLVAVEKGMIKIISPTGKLFRL